MGAPEADPSTTEAENAPEEGRATADRIAERAAELFARQGFAGTSIREISEAAGVTKPTLYYHFGSKDGLVGHIIGAAMGTFADALNPAEANRGSVREYVERLSRTFLAFAAARPATAALICRLTHEPPGHKLAGDLEVEQQGGLEALAAVLQAAMERGELAERDPVLLARSLLGALLTHTISIVRDPASWDASDLPRIATEVTDLFLQGARHAPERGGGDKE
jgi:AcrR family transcriptional regulator